MADGVGIKATLIPVYRFSVDPVTWIATSRHGRSGAVRVQDDVLSWPYLVPLSQVNDAAWMEVAERCDEIIRWNCRWAFWSSWGLG
jgi:hypothetical protein